MRTMSAVTKLSSLLLGLVLSVSASASLVTCGDSHRSFSLSSADACKIGDGNPSVGDINAAFNVAGGWNHVGGIDAGKPSNTLFSLDFTAGGFGKKDSSGVLTISNSFWNTYGAAVLSFHVGNGSVHAPDFFAFLITPETLNGTWAYDWISGNGGGFSNMHLWGSGVPVDHNPPPPIHVSEPALPILFLLGVIGLVAVRRRAF